MKAAAYCALLAMFLVGCGESRELPNSVQLDGSSTVFPLSAALAEEFLAVRPEIRLTVGVSGTGGGFKKLANGEIDITSASRPIKASELEALAKAEIEFLELPIAYDGLSVVVHSNNDWVDFLTIDELQRIWQPDSVVKTWRDVRFEWPDEAIRLYGPSTNSGTFDYFTEMVNGKPQLSRADFSASEDDNFLAQGIAGDQYALGYFGHAYYFENSDKIRLVPVDAGFGPVSPSGNSISSGDYTPLTRVMFLYVRVSALERVEVRDFVSFYLRNAAQFSAELGYFHLPASVYAQAYDRFEKRTRGSLYQRETESDPKPKLKVMQGML